MNILDLIQLEKELQMLEQLKGATPTPFQCSSVSTRQEISQISCFSISQTLEMECMRFRHPVGRYKVGTFPRGVYVYNLSILFGGKGKNSTPVQKWWVLYSILLLMLTSSHNYPMVTPHDNLPSSGWTILALSLHFHPFLSVCSVCAKWQCLIYPTL